MLWLVVVLLCSGDVLVAVVEHVASTEGWQVTLRTHARGTGVRIQEAMYVIFCPVSRPL